MCKCIRSLSEDLLRLHCTGPTCTLICPGSLFSHNQFTSWFKRLVHTVPMRCWEQKSGLQTQCSQTDTQVCWAAHRNCPCGRTDNHHTSQQTSAEVPCTIADSSSKQSTGLCQPFRYFNSDLAHHPLALEQPVQHSPHPVDNCLMVKIPHANMPQEPQNWSYSGQ